MKKKLNRSSLKKYSIIAGAAVGVAACSIVPPVLLATPHNEPGLKTEYLSTTTQIDVEIPNDINKAEQNQVLSVLTPSSEGLTEKQIEKIKNVYATKPSDILTNFTSGNGIDSGVANGGVNGDDWPANSIFNILKFDDKFLNQTIIKPGNGTYSPQVYNLASTSTYATASSLDSANTFDTYRKSDHLPAFDKINGTGEVTQNYLDENGILPLEIVFYVGDNVNNPTNVYVAYVFISGFGSRLDTNSSSSKPILPATTYVKTVSELTDQEIVNFPQFTSDNENTLPNNKSLVEGTRQNDMTTGTITFDLSFGWTPTDTLTFDSGFKGIIPKNKVNSNNANQSFGLNVAVSVQNLETSYTQRFSYTGFQPSPNTSTEQVIYILAGIIAGTIAVVIVLYFVSIVILKRIREKRAV